MNLKEFCIYLAIGFGILLIGSSLVNYALNETKTDMPDKIIRFNYDGHSYIKFKSFSGTNVYSGVTHDPDCNCYKK